MDSNILFDKDYWAYIATAYNDSFVEFTEFVKEYNYNHGMFDLNIWELNPVTQTTIFYEWAFPKIETRVIYSVDYLAGYIYEWFNAYHEEKNRTKSIPAQYTNTLIHASYFSRLNQDYKL